MKKNAPSLLCLFSLLALSVSPLAAQAEAATWSIRVAALDIVGEHDTLWLRTGPEKNPLEINLNTRIFSEPIEYKGPAGLVFFTSEADAKAVEPPVAFATTILRHSSSLILFSPHAERETYQAYTIADADFPFGSFRLVNFSTATVRAEFSGRPVTLRPKASETVPFRDGQNAVPVRILAAAEGLEPRVVRQTSWSIIPTQRELVLFFPNPANGLVRLRHFVDSSTE